jgi:hypothetical protein
MDMAASRTRQNGQPSPGASAKHVTSHLSVPHQAARLIFDAGQPYEKFRGRYEAVVPMLDPRLPGERARRHARWPDIVPETDLSSQHGFVLYWRADMTALMTEEGELRPSTGYLMGNHAIAEKIYLHDPAVMLYAPLRTLIYIDADDRTRFAVDQPSTVFASFADPAIAELGLHLDRQLAELLDLLGVEASPVLGAGTLTGSRNGLSRLRR